MREPRRATALSVACSVAGGRAGLGQAASPEPHAAAKTVSFSILEDYDKGEPLTDVARDFALMRDLGITIWRGSFGWDDYEQQGGASSWTEHALDGTASAAQPVEGEMLTLQLEDGRPRVIRVHRAR